MKPYFIAPNSWRYRSFQFLTSWILSRGMRGVGRIKTMLRRALFGRTPYILVPYLKKKQLWVSLNDRVIGRTVMKGSIYEPMTINILQAYAAKGYSVIDVGANIGSHIVAASHDRSPEWAQQMFFAFEPNPLTYAVLEENLKVNELDYVSSACLALGSSDTTQDLYVSKAQNHVLDTLVPDALSDYQTFSCQVTSLDKYFLKQTQLSGPVIIKLDVQGYEPFVLNGGSVWLGQLNELALVFEVEPKLLTPSDYTAQDIIQLVRDMGFKSLYLIDQAAMQVKLLPINWDWGDRTRRADILAIKGENTLSILNEALYDPTLIQPHL